MTIEKIVQAVTETRDHQQDAWPDGAVVESPLHPETVGERPETSGQCVEVLNALDDVERNPHEEPFCRIVSELGAVDDVAADPGKEPRHRMDDAGDVGTGQGQDVSAAYVAHVRNLFMERGWAPEIESATNIGCRFATQPHRRPLSASRREDAWI